MYLLANQGQSQEKYILILSTQDGSAVTRARDQAQMIPAEEERLLEKEQERQEAKLKALQAKVKLADGTLNVDGGLDVAA